MTATADSRYLYVAEGGGVAVIDSDDGQSGFETEHAYLQVSSQAVVPSALLLDPEAGEPLNEDSDVLYVAGGRSGVWAMKADPDGDGWATRIDDWVNPGNPTHASRRWCNDLVAFQLDVGEPAQPQWFLAALFAKRNGNRLRIYDIPSLRQSLKDSDTLGVETGHEVQPLQNVKIQGNGSAFLDPQSELNPAYAFGYGMAVDTLSATEAYVYVALGSAGIVRVHVESEDLESSSTTSSTVEDGPAFGRDTWYEDNLSPTEVYDHYFAYDITDDGARVFEIWNEPPFFVDVAVQNDGSDHFLYATVDHAGWVRFDLSAPWNGHTPIDHHEGVLDAIQLDDDDSTQKTFHVNVADDSARDVRTYTRKIDYATFDGETFDGPVLVVTAGVRSIRRTFDATTEGWTLGIWGERLGPYEPPACKDPPGPDENPCDTPAETPYDGDRPYTLLYDLDTVAVSTDVGSIPAPTLNHRVLFLGGGSTLYVPPGQASTTDDKFFVFGGEGFVFQINPDDEDHHVDINSTFKVEVDWSTLTENIRLVRRSSHRPGHFNHEAGVCILDPDIVFPGGNDAGVRRSGLLYLCNEDFQSQYDPAAQPSWLLTRPEDDSNGSFTFTGDPQAQWQYDFDYDGDSDIDADDMNHVWVWSSLERLVVDLSEPDGVDAGSTDWALSQLFLGDSGNLCAGQGPNEWPSLGWRVYVGQKQDRLGFAPRGQFASGTVSGAYDDYVDGEESGLAFLFGTRIDTSEGLVVMDRGLLMTDALDTQNLVDESNPDETVLNTDQRPYFIQQYETHPEFTNIPLTHSEVDPFEFYRTVNLLRKPKVTAGNYSARIFKRAGDNRWLLAAPSTSVALDPLHPAVTDDTHPLWVDDDQDDDHDWLPDAPYDGRFTHGLLALFDIHDVDALQNGDDLARAFIVGPDPDSNLIEVDLFDDSTNRTFLFVADFGGRLYVLMSRMSRSRQRIRLRSTRTPTSRPGLRS